jgi:hypothetical protein
MSLCSPVIPRERCTVSADFAPTPTVFECQERIRQFVDTDVIPREQADARTIDTAAIGGYYSVVLEEVFVGADVVLGEFGRGFQYPCVPFAPGCLTQCMRWLGAALWTNEIALDWSGAV